ncbi:FadR/GntR family transcriptional regulator [Hydrogenophaga sp. BPS33]|uniref:FadR/GntR family transcriptional regulator n=1 Tax=Hydrogenophaga sp. BPS33 TaxID=2651974 RepID=UPI00132032F7|nr:FCD domain-containing protein [Hydrogenophaga sp. BPS33]QHE87560.1 FadR family transcriptional regulator [Hydrogenophaga sp. BPS33]
MKDTSVADSQDTKTQKAGAAPTYKVLSQSIIDQILRGHLKPGDALPTEAALCEQFGVNRSTVREGVRLLEETGMLRRVNAKRLVISRPSTSEMAQQLERAMRLHEVTFFELWETAMVLEPKMAALAAHQLNAQDLEALELNLEKTAQSLDDPETLAALDVDFHNLVARGVHNRVLLMSREPMARMFYPAFEAVLSRVGEAGPRLYKAHQAIFTALRAGRSEEAAQWMEKHIKDFRVGFELASLDFQSNAISERSATWNE